MANKKTVKKLCRWGLGRRGKRVGAGVQNKGKRGIVDFFVLQKQRRHSFVNQDGGISAERAHSMHNTKWYSNSPVTNPPTPGEAHMNIAKTASLHTPKLSLWSQMDIPSGHKTLYNCHMRQQVDILN